MQDKIYLIEDLFPITGKITQRLINDKRENEIDVLICTGNYAKEVKVLRFMAFDETDRVECTLEFCPKGTKVLNGTLDSESFIINGHAIKGWADINKAYESENLDEPNLTAESK